MIEPVTDGKPKQPDKAVEEPPYSEAGLAALEKSLARSPVWRQIKRLIASVRHFRGISEEQGWKATELETQLRDSKEAPKSQVLIVVESDGFIHVRHSESVACKIVVLYPWEELEAHMETEGMYWRQAWLNGRYQTALPNYVSTPNRVTPDELSNVLKWQQNIRTLEVLKELKVVVESKPKQQQAPTEQAR